MSKNLSEKVWDKTSEWIDGIGVVVKEMAKQLGVAAEHVYEVYTKQMFAEGLTTILIYLLFTLIAIVLSFIIYRFLNKDIKEDKDLLFFPAIPIILWILMSLMFSPELHEAILKMINPEYYTMKNLLEMVKETIK
ncbi:membrane protein [Geobacillus virus E3]|uniref:membrane protein n=1 Tax=Geobacillus virus E3 TaxID=1572712 RepID=UPI00067194EA|nr:membrane protein [Geobacillus virus E3]AJA41403.1 hypothetical protein E3_084 [Geobacillus virus E3]